jgi:hypothetical protein
LKQPVLLVFAGLSGACPTLMGHLRRIAHLFDLFYQVEIRHRQFLQ